MTKQPDMRERCARALQKTQEKHYSSDCWLTLDEAEECVDAIFAELAEPTETEEWPDYKGAEAFYRHYWRRMAKAQWEDLSPSTRLNYAEAFGIGRQAMLKAAQGGGDG